MVVMRAEPLVASKAGMTVEKMVEKMVEMRVETRAELLAA